MNTAVAERPQERTELSPAQRQKQRLDQFMSAVEKRQDQIGTLLSDSGIDPRLFLETCRRSLMRDPELVNCDPASFIQAALNCAADGLVPDGRKAAIVRFKGAAQYMPMYQGLLDIAYRSGQFQSIQAHVVYEGDEFDHDMGDKPFIRHKRPLESTSTKIIGAYAIAHTTNGGIFREVMGAADLAKVRAVSRATKGPNVDWPGEMARKAPVRRLWKYLPKTPAMDSVAIHDDATYDHTQLAAANEHGRQLRPGFNPPAITNQPGEVVAMPLDEVLDGDFIPQHQPEEASVGRETPLQEAAEVASEGGSVGSDPSAPQSALPLGMKTGADLLAEQQSEAEPEDPLEWKAGAARYVEAAHDIKTLNGLNAQWDDEGHWDRLKKASKGDWDDLVNLMRARKRELEADEARG